MNIHICTKNGLFLLQRVTKTQSEKQGSKKRKIIPPSQITCFLATNGLTTNKILYNRPFWRTWFSMLQRVTNFYLLLKIHGYNIWFCESVGVYCFHSIAKWRLKCSQIWWRKLGRYVSSQPLHLVLFVHVHLAFGCFM